MDRRSVNLSTVLSRLVFSEPILKWPIRGQKKQDVTYKRW